MKKIFSFIVFVSFFTLASGQWQILPKHFGFKTDRIAATDSNHIWVSGEVTTGSQNAWIARSVDGGQTWDSTSIQAKYGFWKLEFVDHYVGFALTMDTLFRSLDGGSTWDGFPLPAQQHVSDFSFISADTGWINIPNQGYFSTSDAGQTWNNITPDSNTSGYTRLYDSNRGQLIMVAFGEYRLATTLDGGQSWSIKPIPYQTYYMEWFLSGVCYAVARNANSPVYIPVYRSVDNGQSWMPVVTPGYYNDSINQQLMNDISFVDENTGWLILRDPSPDSLGIYRTDDGGQTWTLQSSEVPLRLACVDDSQAWALDYYGRRVLRTTNGGGTTGLPEQEERSLQFNLSPNPSYGSVSLQLSETNEGKAIIMLSGIDGVTIRRWTEITTYKGSPIELDLSYLPNGVYLINININDIQGTRKLIIVH